jgi:hypothetical protein
MTGNDDSVLAAPIATDPIAGPAPDPVCTIGTEGGRVHAQLDGDLIETVDPLRLATVDEAIAVRADYEQAVTDSVASGSLSLLTAAIERLLAATYDALAGPLHDLLDGLPRVALRLTDEPTCLLPIETAHREGEPALFETMQLYRLDLGRNRGFGTGRPRRFDLRFHHSPVSELDIIALEQNLIRWVSSVGDRAIDHDPIEPLIHIAGHDPVIPDDIVDPWRRAHVVLSGCRSVHRALPSGVASAVGSLWDVDDHSSSSMMAAYHARLASGIGPVEALRQAQLLHRHLPPAAWASYVHVGLPI